MNEIETFILIGGKSSRFGSDKAFAEFQGRSLAARAAETVECALPGKIRFVVGSDGQFAAELILRLGRPMVADLEPGFGAWSGLHTALAYSASEWTFVLACDMPFVSGELIRRLAGMTADHIDAVVPRQTDGRLQPLCAFYRSGTVSKIIEKSCTGRSELPPLRTIFDSVRTRIVELEEYGDLDGSDEFFHNVNRLGDLEGLTGDSGSLLLDKLSQMAK